MSDNQPDGGGPAYHSHPDSTYAGMTLRDWFAGLALQGEWSVPYTECGLPDSEMQHRAKVYYRMADAMLKVRSS